MKRSNRSLASLLIPAAVLLVPLVGVAKLASASGGDVAFVATGPGGLKIEGGTKDLTVAEDDKSIKVTVPLKNLETGIDLRNKHLREKYLEVPKYPDAVLEITRASLGGKESGEAEGQLTMHGETQPLKFNYRTERKGDQLLVKSDFVIDIRKWKVEPPAYMGLKVKPEVNVKVAFSAKDDAGKS